MSNSSISEKAVVDVLMQEYLSARQEVIMHVQIYKNTFGRNSAILITVVGILLPLLGGQDIKLPITGSIFHSTRWTDLVILFTISTIAFLLIFNSIAILFSLQVLAERCLQLEQEINKIIRGTYLIWERFAHQVWARNSVLVSKMPEAGAIIFFYLLVLLFAVGIPFFILARNLCAEHDSFFTSCALVYTWYLVVTPATSIFVNLYTMGNLRSDCRKMIQEMISGRVSRKIDSGITTLFLIAGCSAVIAAILVFVIASPHSTVCNYVGTQRT